MPRELSVAQFTFVIQKRIKLQFEVSLFLVIGNTLLPSPLLMGQVYRDYKDDDGFLYISYMR